MAVLSRTATDSKPASRPLPRIALVTGADRGLGLALTAGLLAQGWRVFAGQYLPDWSELAELRERYSDSLHLVPLDVASTESVRAAAAMVGGLADRIDLLVSNAGVNSRTTFRPIRETQDYAEMRRLYDVNAIGALRVAQAFLPLTDRSDLKRLCFVSSEAGSINRAERKAWYGYCASKAALNMGVSMLFNALRPEGYTFRIYHPGWVRSYMRGTKNTEAELEPEDAARPALAYFLRDRGRDPHRDDRSDEDRLVLRDWRGREWPW
jgi:NAD(P)-dependent dehydrogenase (short-subunit alcohol dehydrogenase family)